MLVLRSIYFLKNRKIKRRRRREKVGVCLDPVAFKVTLVVVRFAVVVVVVIVVVT